jgi:ribosome-associated toxin RatA of RatAB toxin-antitoxin module
LIDLSTDERDACQDKVKGHTITCYWTLILLTALLMIEFLQLISKIKEGEPWEYFGLQNTCELFMFGLTIALFVTQWHDDEMEFKFNDDLMWNDEKREANHMIQKHLLGWALFLAWMDLTIFLGKMDVFGIHIYMSWQIMRSMFLNLAVFIPSLVAFASAFHCFLINNPVFEGSVSSVLKTFEMLLGEVDFSDNFLYDNVKEIEGANHSVQIMLVFFIIYGILIIMNLIVALMVNKMDVAEAEIILAQQRIEEISSMADMGHLFDLFRKHCSSQQENAPSPNMVCITAASKQERNGCFKKLHRKWKLKEHGGSTNCCKEVRRFERLIKFYPRSRLVKETVEMLKTKIKSKDDLMKEVKDIQDKSEERLHELVYLADGDYCVWPKK